MKRDRKTFYICLTGLMAALACVSNYISIATPASRIHIGNAVCVLSGLLLGPLYGFFAAAIGNGLFDTSAITIPRSIAGSFILIPPAIFT